MSCRLCKGKQLATSDDYTTVHMEGTFLVLVEDFKQGEPYRTYVDILYCPQCGRNLL